MSWWRMRQTGRSPRPKPVPPPTPTPVVVLDEDDADDDSEVFIIKDAAEIARAAAACNSKKGNSSGSNVINLDDDEDEEEGGGGGGPSTAGDGRSPASTTSPARAFPRNRYGLDYVSDSEQSNLSEGSDSDTDADGSSDCEMLGDTGTARKDWETAASRRAMPHDPLKRKDVRASTSSSSAESSTYHDASFEDLFASGCPLDDGIAEYFSCAFNQAGPSSADGAKHGTGTSSARNVQECPMDHDSSGRTCSSNPDTAANDEATHSRKGPVPEKAPETSHPPLPDETLNPEGYTSYSFVSKNRVFPACSADWKDKSRMFVSTSEENEKIPEGTSSETCSLSQKDFVDDPEKLGLSVVVQDGSVFQDCLIGDREKHKESDEYKRAAEIESASRQRQLAIQSEEAKEAKRLRKRKKAEALRLLDTQKRQKQRLEEVRETQRKGEEDIYLKEQCRGAIQLELKNIERTCTDVSSILRALGIPVQGGEVKAAYKRALLKFHPDRVSRTDIYQQVKAEETFKFINSFKEKLKL
ncbi:unnamed protein product [Alopecurus aequalis]